MGRDCSGDWEEDEFIEIGEFDGGEGRDDVDPDALWAVIEIILRQIVMARGPIEPGVFITGGGSHYHWHSDCPMLAKWQAVAFENGFTPRPIEQVPRSAAEADRRRECRTCRSYRLFQEQAGGEAA